MTVAAQGGLIGFGVQNAKIGRGNTFLPANVDYFKVRAPRIDLGVQQSVQALQPEVGGALTPTGVYKDQVFYAGNVDLLPRLQTFGILLYGALGKLSTTTNSAFGVANNGVNTHKFTFDPAAPASQPWMSFRRMIPGAISAENNGETGFDCKINSMRLTIPGRGKIATRVSVVGRDFLLDDASAWSWTNTSYEDAGLIPESGRGYFKVAGVELPMLGLQVDIVNGLTSPNDEMVLGDFHPDDFLALSRGVVLRGTYKYQNDDLYRKILTGTADGTEWNSLPFFTETAGSDPAFEAFFEAPTAISGAATTVNYGIKLTAKKVAWQVEGPPILAGGGTVTLNLVGTVIQPDTGDYFTVEVLNEQTSTYYLRTWADMSLGVTVDDATPAVAQESVFTITATNIGPDSSVGVKVSAPIPAGYTYVSSTPSVGNYNPTNGVWSLGTVVKDAAPTLAIHATVDAGESGHTITLAATVSATTNDAVPTNDTASVAVVVS